MQVIASRHGTKSMEAPGGVRVEKTARWRICDKMCRDGIESMGEDVLHKIPHLIGNYKFQIDLLVYINFSFCSTDRHPSPGNCWLAGPHKHPIPQQTDDKGYGFLFTRSSSYIVSTPPPPILLNSNEMVVVQMRTIFQCESVENGTDSLDGLRFTIFSPSSSSSSSPGGSFFTFSNLAFDRLQMKYFLLSSSSALLPPGSYFASCCCCWWWSTWSNFLSPLNRLSSSSSSGRAATLSGPSSRSMEILNRIPRPIPSQLSQETTLRSSFPPLHPRSDQATNQPTNRQTTRPCKAQ